MNHNHYNPSLIYSSKLKRIRHNIAQLQQAQKILQLLPERITSDVWNKITQDHLVKKNKKSKNITKGPFKNTIRKTIHYILLQQKTIEQQMQSRLQQIDLTLIPYEQSLIQNMKQYFCRAENQSEKE